MTRSLARAACAVIALATTLRLQAAALEFHVVEAAPPAVAALGSDSEIEAFALAAAGSTAVVSIAPSGDASVSTLRYRRGGEQQRTVPLGGRLTGLAVTGDGNACYAVVRVSGKKGVIRGVELVRIDLRTAKASSVANLPVTAAGIAITRDDATLLVAAKDEVRTFAIPEVASGRLYRVIGDNVGVSPVEGTTYAIVAQRSRVALVDLSAPQDRDGLVMNGEAAAPAPLRGMLAPAGEGGPIAQGDAGSAWRVSVGDLPAPPPPPVAIAPAEPVTQKPEPVPAVAVPPSPPPSPPAQPPPPAAIATHEIPGEPGTVTGSLSGPAIGEVAAVIFLGPDNVLREAARVVPDASGRFAANALKAGSYRIVAAGKEGRVLICRPPYISLRVGSNSAVEAPELTVLRAE